ncbi:Type I restriction-modification system, specificity subunit S [hydrothermal vent metagenome]|uniref:Type I restriction-modification system, specificity subunit S n=1 Tax=hydrothermal vent metagenome TaxID=652676 RepID=A0A3B0S5U3_9ZZZZ
MARLYCVAENYVQSDQLYDSLFLSFPEEQSARQAYVRNLMKRGLYEKALLHIRWFLEFDLDFSGLDQFEEHCTLLLDLCEQKPAILPEGILPWLLQNSPVASRQDRDGSILMVVSSLRAGGAERQVLNTLKVLKAQVDDPVNIQLLVGSLDPKKSANFYLNDILQTGVDVCEFENGDKTATCSAYEMTPEQTAIANIFAAMPADVRRFALPVYHECCANRPSVIHLWQDRLGVCGAMAAIAAGVPRIVIGARSTRPDARRRHRRYLKPIYQTLLKARPKQICLLNNSHAGADDYAKWLQLSANQIQVIHNGFDLEALGRRGSVKAGKNSRETINIPKSAFVFGSVGRFTMEKRPELWVDTAMILAKHLDTAHFLLVGDGPLLEAQAKRAKASPYSDRFHFVGIKRPVEPWMSAMDLLMLTSKREGLPNVLVEAQALEIAVATTNAGGAKEAVAANGAGLVFSSDQPDAMAQQVMEFIQDADEFAAARQRAKVWVNNAFTLKDMAKKVLSCYS